MIPINRIRSVRTLTTAMVVLAMLSPSIAADCGCETACDGPSAPVCGAEPVCDLEPACGCEVACSCDSAVCSKPASPCGGNGFLSKIHPGKDGPFFQALDAFAGSIDCLASGTKQQLGSLLKCSHASDACDACDDACSVCISATIPGTTDHGANPVLVPPSQPRNSASPKATILPRTTPNPLQDPHIVTEIAPLAPPRMNQSQPSPSLAPLPQPMPMPSSPEPISTPRKQPGSLFDSLQNPFEDDSVQVHRRRAVSHAAFEVAKPSATQRDDYADYFRR